MMRVHEISKQKCVFAVLDAPAASGKHRRQELFYQFEAVLPQPVDELQIVISGELEGKVIACGCSKAHIHTLLSQAEIVIPDSFPEWVCKQFSVPISVKIRESLNLLTGSFQPQSVKKYEGVTAKLFTVMCLVVLVLVVVTSQRRIRVIDQQQTAVEAETDRLLQSVLPQSSDPGTQPDTIRFAMLMNSLQSTRTGVGDVQTEDLVADLADIFEGWPMSVDIQMQSLNLRKDILSIQLSVQKDDKVAQVIAKFSELEQWSILSRTTTPRSGGMDLNIRFQRRGSRESES